MHKTQYEPPFSKIDLAYSWQNGNGPVIRSVLFILLLKQGYNLFCFPYRRKSSCLKDKLKKAVKEGAIASTSLTRKTRNKLMDLETKSSPIGCSVKVE